MRINLKDFGGFLSSPELGKRIAISVLDSLRKEPENNVIMDFSGVQSVNKHFCEEFVSIVFRGVGIEEFRKRIVMQNQTQIVRLVFDAVIGQKRDTPVEGIDAVIGAPIHTVHIEKKEEAVEQRAEVNKVQVQTVEPERVRRAEEIKPVVEKKVVSQPEVVAPKEVTQEKAEEKSEEKKESATETKKRVKVAKTTKTIKVAAKKPSAKTKTPRTEKKEKVGKGKTSTSQKAGTKKKK